MSEADTGRGSGRVELKEGVENRDECNNVDGCIVWGGEGDEGVPILVCVYFCGPLRVCRARNC